MKDLSIKSLGTKPTDEDTEEILADQTPVGTPKAPTADKPPVEDTEALDTNDALSLLLAEPDTEEGALDTNAALSEILSGMGKDVERANGEDLISTQMYEDMSFSDAEELYKKLETSPNVTVMPEKTGLKFTDKKTGRIEIIPRPSKDYLDAFTSAVGNAWDFDLASAKEQFDDPKATVGITDKLVYGAAESIGAVLETAAAAGEKLGFEDLIEGVRLSMPHIDTDDDISDMLLTDGLPAVIASGGPAVGAARTTAFMAGKLPTMAAATTVAGKRVQSVLKATGIAIRGTVTALVAESAATATVSTEEGTAVTGDTATMFPLLKGIKLGGTEEEQSEADKVLSHRLNVLTEAMIAAGIIKPAAELVKGVGSLAYKVTLKRIFDVMAGSDDALEKRIYMEVMDSIAMLDEGHGLSPAAAQETRARIVERMVAHKDVFMPGMNALADDDPIVLDTIAALLRGEDNPATRALLGGVRQGFVTKGGAGQTIAAMEGPQRALEEEFTTTAQKYGGDTPTAQTETIAGAADDFAGQARGTIDSAAEAIEQAQVAYDSAVNKLTQDFGTDINFGGDLTRLNTAIGTEIPQLKTGKREAVQQYIKDAYESMSKKKNDLYAAISGGVVNPQTLRNIFSEVTSESITAASDAVNASKPLRKLMDMVKPKELVEEVDGKQVSRIETDDETLTRIQQTLDDEGIDFGFFYREIRPELSQAASDLYVTSPPATRMLRKVIKGIDELMVDDVSVNDPALGDAAKEAKRYYSEDYAPVWRSKGKLQDYSDIHDMTLGRGGDYGQGFAEKAEAFAKDILTGYNASSVDNLSQAILAGGGDKESAGAIADYMILDVLNNLASDIRNTKDLATVDFKKITEMVQQYAEVLNKSFPEKADQLNAFLRQLEGSSGNIDEMGAILTKNSDNLAQARKAIEESELSKFLSKTNPDDLMTTGSPYAAFESIFQQKKEGLIIVNNLMARTEGLDPARKKLVLNGMRTAYMRFLRDKSLSVAQESAGSSSLKQANLRSIEEQMNSFLAMGQSIFKDAPEYMDRLAALMDLAGTLGREKKAIPIAGMSATAFLQESKTATGRLINMTLGPLNRLGTQFRSISGMILDKKDPSGKAQRILDRFFADPNYVIALSKRFDKAPMDEELKSQMIAALFSAAPKVTAASDGGEVNQQMSDLFPTQ